MNNSKKSKKLYKENIRKTEEETEIETITIDKREKSEIPSSLYYYVNGIKIKGSRVEKYDLL
jgi:hypothetical protein